MPVRSDLVDTGSGSGSTTTLVALDSAVAPEVVLLRPDLAGPSPSTLYAPLQHDRGADLPAIATAGLLRARDAVVGDTVDTTVRGVTIPVRIVAAVQQFPTVTSGEGLVVDLASLQRLLAAGGQRAEPSQWWLRVPEPTAPQVVAAVGHRAGLASEVVDRFSVRDALQDDPLALGFQSALRIALVAGMLFAAVGFGVSVLLSTQERRGELALLRALGMPRRAVAATVWLEQGLVLGLGVVLGLAVGLVVSTLIVPLTTVSSRTGAVVPPAIMTIPAAQTGALVAALLAILGATLAVVTRTALRGGTATGLQLEDQS